MYSSRTTQNEAAIISQTQQNMLLKVYFISHLFAKTNPGLFSLVILTNYWLLNLKLPSTCCLKTQEELATDIQISTACYEGKTQKSALGA